MGAKYTFLDVAQDVLKEAKKPLGYNQIWEIAEKKGLDKKLPSIGKTPWETLGARLYVNTKEENSIFYIASKRPTTFYLKAYKKDINNLSNIEESKKETLKDKNYNERDLHTILVKYLNEDLQFNVYCTTIYHEKSAKKTPKGSQRWNFPDIVGVHFPFNDDYEEMTLELLDVLQQSHCKFYSFELKKELDWSNLKECYFQAVSNSSWANEGYLVVFKKIDEEIIDELKRLNASFGIGVIWLQTSGIKVILSAKNKEIDIVTLDMLINKNPDFESFIKNVLKDMKAKDKKRIVKDNYDEILDDEGLQKYLNSKKIIVKES